MSSPRPGAVFEQCPTSVKALPGWPLPNLIFPDSVALCRARGSQPSDKLAFLIHGLTQNEDYFGLVVPHLLRRKYDVWALRLPGYVAAGEEPSFWQNGFGLSIKWFAWVAASALVHLQRSLRPSPQYTLAWGHSMGGTVLATAVAEQVELHGAVPNRLVFEAPAFGECITSFATVMASSALVPDDVMAHLAKLLLVDDLLDSDYATAQCTPPVPGHTSRVVFNMNVLALLSPLNRFPKENSTWLKHSRFVVGLFDRLVEADKVIALLDSKQVPAEHRLILRRNHMMSLTSAEAIIEGLGIE